MAIARYKVLKDDFGYKLGENLVLTPEDAEKDLALGRLQLIEYLDPEDELDGAKIRRFYDNPSGGHRDPEPSLEEAVKGITGKKPAAARKDTSTGADDGADGGEANTAAPSMAGKSQSKKDDKK